MFIRFGFQRAQRDQIRRGNACGGVCFRCSVTPLLIARLSSVMFNTGNVYIVLKVLSAVERRDIFYET